jgi:hypothetical protein
MSDLPKPVDVKLITDEDEKTKGVQAALIAADLGTESQDRREKQRGNTARRFRRNFSGRVFGSRFTRLRPRHGVLRHRQRTQGG